MMNAMKKLSVQDKSLTTGWNQITRDNHKQWKIAVIYNWQIDRKKINISSLFRVLKANWFTCGFRGGASTVPVPGSPKVKKKSPLHTSTPVGLFSLHILIYIFIAVNNF